MTSNFHDLCAEPLAQEAYVAFVQICKGGSDDAGTYDADEAIVRRALKRLHELESAALAEADGPAVPESREPAAGEVAELVETLKGIAYWRLHGTDKPTSFDIRQAARLTRAAELLERLSPPQPVPVSERLPEPEDCDAEGRCWWFAPETEVDFGGWTFGTTEICANSQWVDWENTHWLPAHALPLPEVDE